EAERTPGRVNSVRMAFCPVSRPKYCPAINHVVSLDACHANSFGAVFGSMSDATRILDQVQHGDGQAAERLLPVVYDELRRLAAQKMANEAPGQTLQPTALVHEAWLRLSQECRSDWKNREQFYAVAAEAMRRILVDRARRRRSHKHGGDLKRLDVDAVQLPFPGNDELVLNVHDALERLAVEDPEKAEVVKLRFFVGLENTEIATLLGVSEKTVRRHWTFAKAWLARAMQEGA